MPSSKTNPLPQDGPVAIGHSPEQAAEYRKVTANARHRQASGLAPQGSQAVQTAAPGEAPFPGVQVARQILGAEIARMAMQAEALERQASAVPVIGSVLGPYAADVNRAADAQRAAAREQLAQVRAGLARLESLNDTEAQVWARDFQATHPGRAR